MTQAGQDGFSIQLEITPSGAEILMRLMERFEHEDFATAISDAVKFQDACLAVSDSGHDLVVRMKDGQEVPLNMPPQDVEGSKLRA